MIYESLTRERSNRKHNSLPPKNPAVGVLTPVLVVLLVCFLTESCSWPSWGKQQPAGSVWAHFPENEKGRDKSPSAEGATKQTKCSGSSAEELQNKCDPCWAGSGQGEQGRGWEPPQTPVGWNQPLMQMAKCFPPLLGKPPAWSWLRRIWKTVEWITSERSSLTLRKWMVNKEKKKKKGL